MEGYETARSKQAPFPFTKEVTVDTIASAGNRLWKELVGDKESLKVTSVHLALTGIEFAETGQQTIEDFLQASSSKKRLSDEELGDGSEAETGVSETKATYTCFRCGKSFYSQGKADLSADEDCISDLDYIAKAKLEHEDFHFAQDLASEGKSRSVISVSAKPSGTVSSSAKRRKPPSM
jgi:DNA polymerase eta